MMIRFLLLFGAVSMAAAQSAPPVQTVPAAQAVPQVTSAPAVPATPPEAAPASGKAPAVAHDPVIRFEDASDKAGINFTDSFGSRQLGSLLEGTGAGCIWFDYNNSGLESLYVVNGRQVDGPVKVAVTSTS